MALCLVSWWLLPCSNSSLLASRCKPAASTRGRFIESAGTAEPVQGAARGHLPQPARLHLFQVGHMVYLA
jgi:hypothetical protein